MRVLIACEFSGVVRRAFQARGHEAYSCDLLEAGDKAFAHHYKGDVLQFLHMEWDLMIAHPPCTHLAVSGARWFETKQVEPRQAIYFFKALADAGIPRICIENPVCIMSRLWRKPDQIVQPWQFGHGETKATCIWLKNPPKLVPTDVVAGRESRIHKMSPSPDRSKLRSITYEGIAQAMAAQWSNL